MIDHHEPPPVPTPEAARPAVAEAELPLLIDDRQAAALCGVSRSHWRTLLADGKTPAPIRLGRAVRWRREEIVAWVAAGCPGRALWDATRATAAKRNGLLPLSAGRL